MLRLDRPLSASFGLVLATYAHAVGWPMVRGGVGGRDGCARRGARGGRRRARDRPPRRVARRPAAGARRPPRRDAAPARGDRRRPPVVARATPRRAVPLRPGVFKVDWALDGPVPWTAEGRAARPRSTSAGRSTRSPPPRPTSPPAGTRTGRTSCSSSTRRGTRRARRPARPRPGPTATCRRAPTST